LETTKEPFAFSVFERVFKEYGLPGAMRTDIPGAILPHGAMLVLDAVTLEVLQAAGDTFRLLGVPLQELLGQSAAVLFRPDQIELLRGLAAALDLTKPRHLLDPQLRVIASRMVLQNLMLNLLSQSRWESVSIKKLLHDELNAYASENKSVTLNGIDILLNSKSALSLSLAVHELATNAAKYGALTSLTGCVDVQWQLTSDGAIELTWTETGGPLVEQPKRRGFGSTLIERALGMETGGHAIVHYLPAGVVCNIFLPSSSSLQADEMTPENGNEQSDIRLSKRLVPIEQSEAFRIFVVEDSFLLVTTLQIMFDDLGWIIVGPATRRAEALAMAESETFDAALLDINLDSEMSWDVATLVKKRGIPFVFSTGYDVSLALPDDLVGSAIIAKPYRSIDVAERIREVIAAKSCRA
jgi:two-component sensor histidine kinase